MHRIDDPSATLDHKFTEGSPSGGIPATIVTAAFMNDVQENICQAIEAAGITLAKGDGTQLTKAIRALVAALFTGKLVAGANSASQELPGGLILNMGLVQTAANTQAQAIVFPEAFKTKVYHIGVCHWGNGGAMGVVNGQTLTGFNAIISTVIQGVGTVALAGAYFAIGV